MSRTLGLLCLLIWPLPAGAQLLEARKEPIVYGHHHLNVTDVAAHTRFFVETLGGVPITVGGYRIVKFPNVFVFLRRQPPSGGSKGSSIDHVGFSVPDLTAVLGRVKANGFRVVGAGASGRGSALVMAPDDLQVELIEVKGQQAPSALHHVHFSSPQSTEMHTWYGTVFRAKAAPAGSGPLSLSLPGVRLEFSRAPGEVAHTAGRVLDHVGFEIHPLDAFLIRLEDMGLHPTDMQRLPDLGVLTSFVTDPWGTSLQLTEGLDRIR